MFSSRKSRIILGLLTSIFLSLYAILPGSQSLVGKIVALIGSGVLLWAVFKVIKEKR